MASYPPIIDKAPFEEIITAVWYDIDVADSMNVQHYFTKDAKIFFGSRVVEGRETIHEGYQQRIARGPRLSRHVISNVFVVRADETTAETICCVRLYAGDGTAPLPNPEPISVADQYDKFVRDENGDWLIAERTLSNLFFHPETKFSEPPSK